eukprot:1249029-Prorocentrum_lima.AAC.1
MNDIGERGRDNTWLERVDMLGSTIAGACAATCRGHACGGRDPVGLSDSLERGQAADHGVMAHSQGTVER